MEQVQMTNAQVLDAAAAVRELAEVTLPAPAALKVVRMARALEAAAGDIGKVRQQVVDRFTERDAAGQPLAGQTAGRVRLRNRVKTGGGIVHGSNMNERETRRKHSPLQRSRAVPRCWIRRVSALLVRGHFFHWP